MYPFMTLDGDTEIVHSELYKDGRIKVYVEQPTNYGGFNSAICYLPQFEWSEIVGFTQEDLKRFGGILETKSSLLLISALQHRC